MTYPTDETLANIRHWDTDHRGLMEFVRENWAYADCGYWTQITDDTGYTLYSISTAGWSGNEMIVEELQHNHWFWMSAWEQSRRGGHYTFKVKFNDQIPE